MQRRFLAALATGLVASAAPALAQQPHGHAHQGQEVKIGHLEVELVVRPGEATLLLLDAQERPVEAARFSASAVVLARGNERRTIEFRPVTANRLIAPIDFAFDGKFRATVTLRGPDGVVGTGRFNVDPLR
jgi:hypothetical protein